MSSNDHNSQFFNISAPSFAGRTTSQEMRERSDSTNSKQRQQDEEESHCHCNKSDEEDVVLEPPCIDLNYIHVDPCLECEALFQDLQQQNEHSCMPPSEPFPKQKEDCNKNDPFLEAHVTFTSSLSQSYPLCSVGIAGAALLDHDDKDSNQNNINTTTTTNNTPRITIPTAPMTDKIVGIKNKNPNSMLYHEIRWDDYYQQLAAFVQQHGHCFLMPRTHLAQWARHQRYQYKRKISGRHSTLTNMRQSSLERIPGFCWDSFVALWEQRYQDLLRFQREHGHCVVPLRYKNRALALWVKRQRRQYKLRLLDKSSNMTDERVRRLNSVGFEWNPRNR